MPKLERMTKMLRLPAICCAFAVALCALVSQPYANIGIVDDWSYIKTLQILARTGHIAYNAWGVPLLGWQLYWADLFVKLFGFSFTTARMSIVALAVVLAFLVQRTLVRMGLNEWNASIVTLTFTLSPVMLDVSVTYVTDVPGMLALVLCLYACLRALQTSHAGRAAAWVCLAALGNAIGGTARQTAWVGIVVAVPCTVWLLRRERRVVIAGTFSWLAGMAIVIAMLRWYSHQPYSITEGLLPHVAIKLAILNLTLIGLRGLVLTLGLFLAPVLLMYVPALRSVGRSTRGIVYAVVALCTLAALGLHHIHKLRPWLAPWQMANFTVNGLMDSPTIYGNRPIVLGMVAQVLLTLVTFAGLVALSGVLFDWLRRRPAHRPGESVGNNQESQTPWHTLAILLVPTTLAYLAVLTPHSAEGGWVDRYQIFFAFIALVFIARFYQETVRNRLPAMALVLALFMAAFNTAGVHDAFAMFRARRAALDEVIATGVAPTQIDGGAEANGWTQVEMNGRVNNPHLRVPAGAYIPITGRPLTDRCHIFGEEWYPSMRAIYALSFVEGACAGLAPFAPVTYSTWLAPHRATLYIIQYP